MFKACTFRTGTTANETTHRFSLHCRLPHVTSDGWSCAFLLSQNLIFSQACSVLEKTAGERPSAILTERVLDNQVRDHF